MVFKFWFYTISLLPSDDEWFGIECIYIDLELIEILCNSIIEFSRELGGVKV